MLKVVNFGSGKGGLSTVGYTIYGVQGDVVASRSTVGVVEIGTSTGIYTANIDLPSYESLVLWDTGDASPKYATEDYQHQITSILETVEPISRIYNSIKNQGEFFAALMDRMGMLQKNEGLQKVNDKLDELSRRDSVPLTSIEEAFNKATRNIKLPDLNVAPPIVNIPPVPDYTDKLSSLSADIESIRKELSMIPKTQKEYTGNFNNISSLLGNLQNKISSDLGNNAKSIKNEVMSLREIFKKFDLFILRIEQLRENISRLDINDKDIMGQKEEVTKEIKRLQQYIYDFVSSPYMQEAKDMNGILMAFGHKRKNG